MDFRNLSTLYFDKIGIAGMEGKGTELKVDMSLEAGKTMTTEELDRHMDEDRDRPLV